MSTEVLPNLAGTAPTSKTAWADSTGILSDVANTTQSIRDGDGLGVGIAGVASVLDLLDVAEDPFKAVTAAGLGWLVEHIGFLREPLDMLAGDPGMIQAQANTWSTISAEMKKLSAEYGHAVEQDIPQWTGDAADAYRGQAEQLGEELGGFAVAADGVSTGITVAGVLVGTERGVIRDMITEFLATMIERGLVALAGAVETLGCTVAAFVADAMAEGAILAGRCASKIAKVLQKLAALASKMGELGHSLEQLLGRLARFAKAEAGSAGQFAGRVTASRAQWQHSGGQLGRRLGDAVVGHLPDGESEGFRTKLLRYHGADDVEPPGVAVELGRQLREGDDREREYREERERERE